MKSSCSCILVSITADFCTDKNVTKITILFLQQKFLSDGV